MTALQKLPDPKPEPPCPRCGSPAVRGGICTACVFTGMLSGAIGGGAAEELVSAAPPRLVGDYELLEELARGGMGVVWRARQRRLIREVALKFVLEGVLPGETAARRFRQEAEVAAQLSHPHIISVYEVGEADGRYFISMELAAGGTLAERLQHEKFTPRAAASLTEKLTLAVQHAHDHGVLHRDLKPANVLFDSAGEPRISDFGLARLTNSVSALTLTSAVMGTPSYMPPEQARGETTSLTTAGDVYGLGAILYELLAGRPAFAGEVPVEVLRRVIDEEPPPLTGVDRDLETICQKCLRKHPDNRYLSARALAQDLHRWQHGEAIRARRISTAERLIKWVRRRPLLATLCLALTIAAIVIAGMVFSSKVELAAARGAAEASAVESQHRRADQHTTAAILAIGRGDSLRALPSLAEAIRIGTGDPLRDRANRIRFGTILRLAPVLEQVWFPSWVQDVQLPSVQDRVVICERDMVRLLNIRDGTDAVPALMAGAELRHAAQHPSLPRLIAETENGQVFAWNITTTGPPARIHGRFMAAPFLFSQNTPLLALWHGNTVRRHSVEELAPAGPVLDHPAPVKWAWLRADGLRIVTFAADHMLRVWNADSGAAVGDPIACAPGTTLLAPPRTPGLVQVKPPEQPGWIVDTEHGGTVTAFNALGNIRAAAHFGSGIMLARSTREGFVISAAEGGDVVATATHGAHGNDARFSSASGRVFTRAVDSGGRLWSAEGRPLTPFLWQGTDPRYLSLNAPADRILVSSSDPEVRLWHLRTRDGAASETMLSPAAKQAEWLRYTLHDQTRQLPVPFSRPGVHGQPSLSCPSPNDPALHVRDASTGRDLYPPLLHHAKIVSAIISPDGRKIASFTTSQCIYLWDAATGRRIGPLLRHDRVIDDIVFSPDSTLLASGGVYTVRIWEAASGTAAAPPMLHGPLFRIWWSGDSTSLLTVDNQGRQRQWNVCPDDRPAPFLNTIARLYSAHQVTTEGALAPLSREESRAAWEAVKHVEGAVPPN